MDKRYNSFSFCRNDYEYENPTTGKKEVNEYMMYEDIKDFLRIAIKNGYQCRIWFDGYTVVIDYNYQDESLSGVSLEWLGEHEYIVNDLEEGAECAPTGGEA